MPNASSLGQMPPVRHTSGQTTLSVDGWFAYAWRNPGGTEPADVAAATATKWIRWGGGAADRLRAIGGGSQGRAVPFKSIVMPLDGQTIPVSDGTARTVVAAGTTISTDYGGIALSLWDTLWVKLDWTTGLTWSDGFMIVRGETADNTTVLQTNNPAVEWVMIASCRGNDTITLWNGESLQRGQEIGAPGSLAAQTVFDLQRRDATRYKGCQFHTNSGAFGVTGVIETRGVGGVGSVNGQGTSADVPAPVVGTSVRLIGSTGSGTDVAFRATAATDQMYLFGGQSVGGTYGNFTAAAVIDRPASGAYNGTLYYHRRQGSSSRAGGVVTPVDSWFMVAADTNSSTGGPSAWVPIMSMGAALTTGWGVYLPLSGTTIGHNDFAYMGTRDNEAALANGKHSFSSPPQVRWTGAAFMQAGAVPNGSTRFSAPERGVLVGWDDGALILYGGYTGELMGVSTSDANVPAAGYGIPVIGMPGATRVVQTIAGTTRRYIPLGRDEILVYRPGVGAGYNDAAWLVVPVGAAGIPPVNGATIVAQTRGTSDTNNGTPVYFLGGAVQVSPGTYLGTTVPTYGDNADSHNVWMNATLPGQTPPGATAALAAVTNVAGAYPGAALEYILLRDPSTMRKVCQVRGALQLSGNVADDATIAAMPGALARNGARVVATVIGTGSPNKPRTVALLLTNGLVGGVNCLQFRARGLNLATNPGLTGGDTAWGTPLELWIDTTIDMA